MRKEGERGGEWLRPPRRRGHYVTDSKRVLEPVHPGELLREDFLEPMGITAYRLAEDIGVRHTRVYDILRGKRSISADTALRLSRYFGMSEDYWLRAQAHYDLEVEKDREGERIEREVKPRAEAQAAPA
jgi:addiction module HigA family antidote